MSYTPFAHLHVHTEYSIVDSIVRIPNLIQHAQNMNMESLAMTDMSNVYGAVKFYKQASKAGIKPILGSHIWLYNEEDVSQPSKLLLYAQNRQGYANICRLLSDAFLHNQHLGRACVFEKDLFELNEGILIVNDAQYGPMTRLLYHDKHDMAKQKIQQYQKYFDDRLYMEIQRIGSESESIHSDVVDFSSQHDLPIVATNAVRFLEKNEYSLHDIKVCIREGRLLSDKRRPKDYKVEQYFKSQQQMSELFSDIPIALENTIEFSKRCNFHIKLGQVFLPDFHISTGQSINEYIADVANDGLQQRIAANLVLTKNNTNVNDKSDSAKLVFEDDVYQQRLDRELGIIQKMGFAGYFLIVSDFINWAKENGVPVGPGRGSGAGSLVAYALGITDLDPLKYDLLFERFLNPERISMPDFDVDFCQEKRDKVIEYVANKYGRDKVSQIITFGTMAAKAVVRDVGRVLGMAYGYVDKVAKLIPFVPGMTLSKALDIEPDLKALYNDDEEVKALLDKCLALEGLVRNVGKHAGGVVIAPTDLTDFTAIYAEQGSHSPVSHYDKDDLEDVGLVKFDFLGLKTLTIIDRAVQLANKQRAEKSLPAIDITLLAPGDKATYQLLYQSNTTAVFQLESTGMKELIGRLKPDCFDDLVALVALYRPGPLESGMVHNYVEVKHGRMQADYLDDAIKDILLPTYGVILYQEQVMNIAQQMCGYTLGSADILRKAMGKKVPEIMAQQRKGFVEGALKNGIEKNKAEYIFDLIEKFAGYGFNKSHSACYALLSYQTAWLKANYSSAFMSATLSSDLDHTDKVVRLISDANAMGLEILPPNVNQGYYMFSPINESKIYYGLGAIKGVGQQILELIVEERQQNGLYKDMFDLTVRVMKHDIGKINRRVLESLICSGAFDCFNRPRALMYANVSQALEYAQQWNKCILIGQDDLFSSAGSSINTPDYLPSSKWSEQEQLKLEKDTLGLYLSGHPINSYRQEVEKITSCSLANLKAGKQVMLIAGLIISVRTLFNRRGEKFAFIEIDDGTAQVEVSVFAKVYTESTEFLRQDKIVIIQGIAQKDERSQNVQFRADELYELSEYRKKQARYLLVETDEKQLSHILKKDVLSKYLLDNKVYQDNNSDDTSPPQHTRLIMRYRKGEYVSDIKFNKQLLLNHENLELIKDLFGEHKISVNY